MNQTINDMEGILTLLLAEVVRADINFHSMQLEGWSTFSTLTPLNTKENPKLASGWADNRFLFVNGLTIKFKVRPVPQNFFNRLRRSLRYLFAKDQRLALLPIEICPSDSKVGFEITLSVSRSEDGTVNYSYNPATVDLKRVFSSDPFLTSLVSKE